MKLYQIKQKQQVPISLETAWDFFSSPENLKQLTPEYMDFQIISGAERSIFQGQMIQYTVKPLLGIPMGWLTEITHVQDKAYFVDNQVFGPYSLWHHKHFFKAIEGGVEMEDIVDYRLPLGFLGQIAHVLFVKKQLHDIFEFRRKKMIELFGAFV